MKDYLSTSKSVVKLTVPDLRNVLGGLQEIITGCQISEQASADDETEPVDNLQTGEHVIVVWTEADDSGKIVRELDSVYSSDKDPCTLSMFFPRKRNLSVWICPKEAKVQTVKRSQIMLRNVAVPPVSTDTVFPDKRSDGYYGKKYKIFSSVITVNYFM